MDVVLSFVNRELVDPLLGLEPAPYPAADAPPLPFDPAYSLTRNLLVMWGFLYIGGLLAYFLYAPITFLLFFYRNLRGGKSNPDGTKNPAWWRWDNQQVKNEIWTSVWSLFIMSGLTAPFEILAVYGYGKMYWKIEDYGWTYFLLSPILFVAFTDCLIYWIHRWLHWGVVYKYIHKLHHKYLDTTPFSAFAFHPLDGFAQSIPYHLFVLFFPMHNVLAAITISVVGLWTINIHDRMTMRVPGLNCAAHHTIHHTKFNYNYGQYTIFWDWLLGTYKDPFQYQQYKLVDDGKEPEDDPVLCAEPGSEPATKPKSL